MFAMSISCSMEAADMEMFPHHSPNRCNGLQFKRAGTAIQACAGPH
jgi:hypothetical protein